MIPKTSPALKLLQQVRDEAHRFAITFHRNIRSNQTIGSELTNISGIGKKTAVQLLKKFGSISNIRKLEVHALAEEIGHTKANKIFEYYTENNIKQ